MKNKINTTEVINRLKNEFGPMDYTIRDLGHGFEIESEEREGLYKFKEKNILDEVKVITICSNGIIIAQYGVTKTHMVKF